MNLSQRQILEEKTTRLRKVTAQKKIVRLKAARVDRQEKLTKAISEAQKTKEFLDREIERLPSWLRDASLNAARRMQTAERAWRSSLQRKRLLEATVLADEQTTLTLRDEFERHSAACRQWLAENPSIDYQI